MLSSCGFEDCANKEMMAKFIEGQEACEVVIDGKSYDINFKERWQMNQRTKKKRKIRCFFGLPNHWKMTDEDGLKCIKSGPQGIDAAQSMQLVTDPKMLQRLEELLNKSLLRHDGTRCTCLHGRSKFVVIKAYQIKNLHLWRRYQRFLRSIEDKQKQHSISPDQISPAVSEELTDFAKSIDVDLAGNQRLLLHGTRDFEVAETIGAEGFDNRIAKRTGLYGSGTYFAAQTCKSAQYASKLGMYEKASEQMLGTMLIARVSIGDPFYVKGPCPDSTRALVDRGLIGLLSTTKLR